jgi:uracil-DNA glycosylase
MIITSMNVLWNRVKQLESQLRFEGDPYPKGLTTFPGMLRGQGFFCGGDGLWRDNPSATDCPSFPVGGTMVLGNDFGCLDNPDPRSPGFLQCLSVGFEDPPTWKIKTTLREAGISGEQCFFTNAYLGLRTGKKSTGRSPGASNEKFKAMCRDFFVYQIDIQRPRLIICLGHEPRRFVAPILLHNRHAWSRESSFPELDRRCDQIIQGSLQVRGEQLSPVTVVIAHPSYAWSTHAQSPRTFQSQHGEAAEIALLAAAWQLANTEGTCS